MVVIGAGNSAGQAAMTLAKYAASVIILARGDSLHDTMSQYLITEIGKTGNITVLPATEITAGGGRCSLQTLTLRHRHTGATEVVPAAALFVMIGTEPHTNWLQHSVARDEQGFILTGPELPTAGQAHRWTLQRRRVATAIGEGAVTVQLLHRYLQAEYDR